MVLVEFPRSLMINDVKHVSLHHPYVFFRNVSSNLLPALIIITHTSQSLDSSLYTVDIEVFLKCFFENIVSKSVIYFFLSLNIYQRTEVLSFDDVQKHLFLLY